MHTIKYTSIFYEKQQGSTNKSEIKNTWKKSKYAYALISIACLPSHFCTKHFLYRFEMEVPGHDFPPHLGAGLEQVLSLAHICFPLPHDFEHVPMDFQCPQEPQFPLT